MKPIGTLSIVLVLFSITAVLPGFAATKIIDYGFEDYAGDSGNASPAPGYIFGTSYEEYWNVHRGSTQIIQNGDSNCAGDAHEGQYYWHCSKYTGGTDPCLGTAPTSTNSRSNISAAQYAYPTGTTSTARVDTIQSNIVVVRLWFRATGDWSSANSSFDGGGGHKFIRLYGGNGTGDSASVLLKLVVDGNDPTPRIVLWDHQAGNLYKEVGVNWQDGNWHSFTFRATRNNDNNGSGNITTAVWVDDWHMSGPGVSTTSTASTLGAQWDHIAFSSNLSAKSATNQIGYDIDEVEVWDGLPDDSPIGADAGADVSIPDLGILDAATDTSALDLSVDAITDGSAAPRDGHLPGTDGKAGSNDLAAGSTDSGNDGCRCHTTGGTPGPYALIWLLLAGLVLRRRQVCTGHPKGMNSCGGSLTAPE